MSSNVASAVLMASGDTSEQPNPLKHKRQRLADSPIKSDSGSLTGATRQEMDKVTTTEIKNHTITDDNFFAQYFPSRLKNKAAELLKLLSERSDGKGYSDGRWEMWPKKPEEKEVIKFFYSMVNNVILETSPPNGWKFGTQAKGLADGNSDRQVDLFISTQPQHAASTTGKQEKSETIISWKTIRVVGELKQDPSKVSETATQVQLAGYAREVFCQPGRRFVHGFLLCGSKMRCLVYDRCGIVTCHAFEVNKEPLSFLTAVVSYSEMNASEIGFDSSILVYGPEPSPQVASDIMATACTAGKLGEGSGGISGLASAAMVTTVYDPTFHGAFGVGHKWTPYFETASLRKVAVSDHPFSTATAKEKLQTIAEEDLQPSSTSSLPEKIYLKCEPFFTRRAIVSRGTSCWEASPDISADASWVLVVKDQWRADTRHREGNILAAIQGVDGVPKLIYHGDVVLGNGLIEDVKYGIRTHVDQYKASIAVDSAPEKSHDPSSTSLGTTPGISTPARPSTPARSKKRRLSTPESSPSESASGAPKKRLVDTSRSRTRGAFILEERDNRVHTRLITTPRGYPLQSFQSYTELIKAVRDAIACHRDVYIKFGILHRDISINNILIRRSKKATVAHPGETVEKPIAPVDPDVRMTDIVPAVSKTPVAMPSSSSATVTPATASTGLLIDFEFAISTQDLDREPSTHRTGTFQYIAVGVLQNELHTYRHDLESFFYVMLYCTIHYKGPLAAGSSPGSNLRRLKENEISTAASWLNATAPQTMALLKIGITTHLHSALSDMAPMMREKVEELMQDFRDALFLVDGKRGSAMFYGTPKKPEELYADILEAFDKCIARLDGA